MFSIPETTVIPIDTNYDAELAKDGVLSLDGQGSRREFTPDLPSPRDVSPDLFVNVVMCVDGKMLVPLVAAMNSSVENSQSPHRLWFHVVLPKDKPLPPAKDLQMLLELNTRAANAKVSIYYVEIKHLVNSMRINFD
eukprot:gene30577-38246_t